MTLEQAHNSSNLDDPPIMAARAKPASSEAPLSIEEIVQQANKFNYDPHVPLRYLLRSADTLQKQASIYEREGNDQQTYLLLFRHAILVLDKFPQHPEAKDPQHKPALATATKAVKANLAKLELLKPRIERRYTAYLQELERRRSQEAALQALEGRSQGSQGSTTATRSRPSSDRFSFGRKKHIDAQENTLLAAKLAQKEIRRRDTARRSVRQAGVSEEQEQERRVGGLWGNWEKDLRRESDELDDVSQDILEAARQRDAVGNGQRTAGSRPGSFEISSAYRYPTVPQKSAYERLSDSSSTTYGQGLAPKLPPKEILSRPSMSTSALPPVLPPKPPRFESYSQAVLPPPIPGKYLESPDPVARPSSPNVPQELSAAEYNFKPAAYLEDGRPLRTVFLPPGLRNEFLRVAAPNTSRNMETCGILCGTLISNALFISKLLIPEQISTSDTCETTNEGAIFEFCDSEDLMMLGWIHTHPTQTCFMSSRDLHTHHGYQVTLDEAISIVCAPSKQPPWGVFRLTDPPGKQIIQNCQKPGIFHPHPDPEHIYIDALRPGHVFELPGLEFQVVDQRPK